MVQMSPEAVGGQKRRDDPGSGDEAPQSPRLQPGLWCERPAGLLIRDLMGQIENFLGNDGKRHGSGLTCTCAQFYK